VERRKGKGPRREGPPGRNRLPAKSCSASKRYRKPEPGEADAVLLENRFRFLGPKSLISRPSVAVWPRPTVPPKAPKKKKKKEKTLFSPIPSSARPSFSDKRKDPLIPFILRHPSHQIHLISCAPNPSFSSRSPSRTSCTWSPRPPSSACPCSRRGSRRRSTSAWARGPTEWRTSAAWPPSTSPCRSPSKGKRSSRTRLQKVRRGGNGGKKCRSGETTCFAKLQMETKQRGVDIELDEESEGGLCQGRLGLPPAW